MIEQFALLADLVLSLRDKIILLLFQTCNTTNGKNYGSIESSVRFLALYDFAKFLSVLIMSEISRRKLFSSVFHIPLMRNIH